MDTKRMNTLGGVAAILALVFLQACGGGGGSGGGVGGANSEPPSISESPYTPYSGDDPYVGVETFIGEAYKDIDPDYEWVQSTKQRLDSMGEGEYLTREEHDKIIDRLTKIQDKHDVRRELYVQLAETGKAWIPPHTAVRFRLESFCLDVTKKPPPSGSAYDKVTPTPEHIKLLLKWYYSNSDVMEYLDHDSAQQLIWKVQAYINKQYGEDVFTESEIEYLRQIYGSDPWGYLQQVQASLGIKASTTLGNKDDLESLISEKLSGVDGLIGGLLKDESESDSAEAYFNIGDDLIGRFVSDYSFYSSELEVVNPVGDSIEYGSLDYTMGLSTSDDYQSVTLGLRKVAGEVRTTGEEVGDEVNLTVTEAEELKDVPTCNMTDAHRDRIVELAQPSMWPNTPYEDNYSREEGVVCNQYVRMVYREGG